MDEIEVKILEIAPDVEKRVIALGGKKVFDGVLHSLQYDTADSALNKKGVILRIRMEGKDCVLGVKKRKAEGVAKTVEEVEVKVEDYEMMKDILSCLGFSVVRDTSKYRRSYEVDGVRVDFDKYAGAYEHIPLFLEVEGESEEDILAFVKKLGFSQEDCKAWGFGRLEKHYKEGR